MKIFQSNKKLTRRRLRSIEGFVERGRPGLTHASASRTTARVRDKRVELQLEAHLLVRQVAAQLLCCSQLKLELLHLDLVVEHLLVQLLNLLLVHLHLGLESADLFHFLKKFGYF
jgi:hypothetical protein